VSRGLRRLALLLALAGPAGADPLDEALRLVEARHPVLAAQNAERQALARQRNWKTDVFVGWTQRGTELNPDAGPNAGIRVTIPLFDRTHEIESARAHSGWMRERNGVVAAFLGEVGRLRELAVDVGHAEASRGLYRDRLEYWRHAVEEGKAEPERLWPEAEALQKADQAYRSALAALEAERERIAREYGGDAWTTLSALLAEIAS
jgi:hypothetical protein